ncbi:MAG TPA: response regulator [Clostridia bacterium]
MDEKNYKVLIADDEYWIRENLRNIINWDEYSFSFMEPAVDGEDVLRRMESDCPDILITDINMPFISGVELVKTVKNRYPQVVTIILSGYNDFEYVRESLLSGAIDYLLKPLTKVGLIQVLAKAVEVINTDRSMREKDKSIREKLLKASSVIRDKELSMMISMDELADPENIAHHPMSEIELDFTGFSLVLIKIYNINQLLSKKYGFDMSQFSYDAKNMISVLLNGGKHIIFNNTYSPNEYIIITESDHGLLKNACENIMKTLEGFTGSPINIAVSRHYFSLKDIRNAYNEASFALMSRRYRPGSTIKSIHGVKDLCIKKRLLPEHENKLVFGIKNRYGKMIKDLVFNQVGLKRCDNGNWLYIEVKQTVDRILNIIYSAANENISPHEIAALENLMALMDKTLESCCADEVCSVMEQIIDEALSLAAPSPAPNETINEIVKLVAEYIDQNYFEQLSLSMLSKLFLVESSYLSRAFKRDTGENLMLYIAKKRIEKSIQLIEEGKYSLTDISYLVGYDDYPYFNRVFRKITGKSPREYKMIKESV